MLNPNDFEPVPTFIQTHMEDLSEGDRILHGMLYPGIYPGEDEETHVRLLRGERPPLESPFFELMRTLVRRGVAVDRLRVLPTGGRFQHSVIDVQTMVDHTAYIDRSTGMRTRHVSYNAAEKALKARFPEGTNELADNYLRGAYERSPHNSFWTVERRVGGGALELATAGIMWYEKRVPLGIQTHNAPIPKDVTDYTQFWDQQYRAATTARASRL